MSDEREAGEEESRLGPRFFISFFGAMFFTLTVMGGLAWTVFVLIPDILRNASQY